MVVSQVTNDPLQNAKKKAFEKNMDLIILVTDLKFRIGAKTLCSI